MQEKERKDTGVEDGDGTRKREGGQKAGRTRERQDTREGAVAGRTREREDTRVEAVAGRTRERQDTREGAVAGRTRERTNTQSEEMMDMVGRRGRRWG